MSCESLIVDHKYYYYFKQHTPSRKNRKTKIKRKYPSTQQYKTVIEVEE